jgi:hypothetical protein
MAPSLVRTAAGDARGYVSRGDHWVGPEYGPGILGVHAVTGRSFAGMLALLIAIVIMGLLQGCAGSNAMVWQTPRAPDCGVRLCKPGGVSSRIDPKKDCVCTGRTAGEILR